MTLPDPSSITSSSSRPIRVFIADSHEVVRAGGRKLLKEEREKTVKNYIVSIFAKLQIERRTQAVALYLKAQQDQGSMREEAFA